MQHFKVKASAKALLGEFRLKGQVSPFVETPRPPEILPARRFAVDLVFNDRWPINAWIALEHVHHVAAPSEGGPGVYGWGACEGRPLPLVC